MTDMATEVYDENTFDYVKFNVAEYSVNNESLDPDAIELPANEFAELKFDVNEYTEDAELTSFDAIDLPVTEYTNLKLENIPKR